MKTETISMSLQDVKLMAMKALNHPMRAQKALGLERAFIASVCILRAIEDQMNEDDRKNWARIQEATLRRQDVAPSSVAWVRENFPAIALTLDAGAGILRLIEQKSLWRELGFESFDQFDAVIEDEAYLKERIKEFYESVEVKPKRGVCRFCRCTDVHACHTPDGPCHWLDDTHTICSACEGKENPGA